MSLYNMVNGVQQATFFILPMLGKHPDEYPRFRDCFVGKIYTDKDKDQFGIPVLKHGKEELIIVYMRVGGGNRDGFKKEIKELQNHSEYVEDFDDNFDNTYAIFVFKVSEKFKEDFKKIKKDNVLLISKEYKEVLYKIYPKLKEQLDEKFN